MHSAFNFSWGNEYFSLSDKVRDKKRNLLKNLKLVIIDEISMVKSDQQFQLDKRLREVTQKTNQLFGNVSVFYVGDIMQLKPCKGRYIFDQPINPDYLIDYQLGSHWQSFEVIMLEKNHRQGDDKVYADMLNRFRIGEQTEDDMKKLQERVRPRNHPDLMGAMFVCCKNVEVDKQNIKRLNEITEGLVEVEAINVHPTIKEFKPTLGKKGEVKNTPFLQTLQMKRNSRVQLTYNIDTLDCLTNGARGEVIDFVMNDAGQVDKVMVKFDEEHQGKQRRDSQPMLTAKFPGCTAIERIMFQYSLSKKKQRVSSTAKVIQFPLSLCFAATTHRFQGQTIHKPNKLAADFRTVFEAAQAYVMLSRVQALCQLFIIGSLPKEKFYASMKAIAELERLRRISINNNPSAWDKNHDWSLKISLLNCHSLADKIHDLRSDEVILKSDVICLTETWLMSNVVSESLAIPGYELHLNSSGRGKGVAIYTKMSLGGAFLDIKREKSQMSRVITENVDVINIYRSQEEDNTGMVKELEHLIRKDTNTIICGDMNLCFLTKRGNQVTKMLEGMGFEQLVREASHLLGGHIDHVYSNLEQSEFNIDVKMHSPYYTSHDHDAFCITITSKGEDRRK